ncbi:hypothetical protein [Chryseobacterium sp. CFS15]|nr:hypothetical protein [Chryseobacterium sp. CFS15]MDQ8142551.1 hypothetical protein [Chryseobacterium sp. CFS15]
MEQDYSKYSNEMLEKMWKIPYDLDENFFFVLGEFGIENTQKQNNIV